MGQPDSAGVQTEMDKNWKEHEQEEIWIVNPPVCVKYVVMCDSHVINESVLLL